MPKNVLLIIINGKAIETILSNPASSTDLNIKAISSERKNKIIPKSNPRIIEFKILLDMKLF